MNPQFKILSKIDKDGVISIKWLAFIRDEDAYVSTGATLEVDDANVLTMSEDDLIEYVKQSIGELQLNSITSALNAELALYEPKVIRTETQE